jgi:hypothetical protein
MRKGNVLKSVRALVLVALFSVPAILVMAQPPAAPRGNVTLSPGGKKVTINFGRPELKGRDVMKMAPAGTVWRMGMNEATELETAATLKFKNFTLKPGKYSLWAKKVSDSDWVLIFNTKTGQWGTEYDAKADLGSTPLTVGQSPSSVELMTITLSGKDKDGVMELTWGPNKLSTTFVAE